MQPLSRCDNGDKKLLVGVKEDGRIKKLRQKVGESLLQGYCSWQIGTEQGTMPPPGSGHTLEKAEADRLPQKQPG